MCENDEILSSSVHSVIVVVLLWERTSSKKSPWNYWQADERLAMELNAHVPHLADVENCFRSFQSKFKELQLNEKEFSLLLFMMITRASETIESRTCRPSS